MQFTFATRCLAAAALLGGIPTSAQTAAPGWAQLARTDAEAALRLIDDNHPGAVPALADRNFLDRLTKARAQVEARLPQVSSYEGYSMLMLGLANSFGDGHIWSSALLQQRLRNWAGLVLARRGGKWIIGAQDRADGDPDLNGARLLACDGTAAEALARERIGGFFANADNEAAMANNAYQFFIGSDAPFYPRLKSCRFETNDGRTMDVELHWRAISPAQIQPFINRALRPGRSGMGISDFAGGKWIALQTLGTEAEPVVAEVERRQAELRAAPMVVLDLRGNGGGNSDYPRRIAEALVGRSRVNAAYGPPDGCNGSYWRASPDNLRTLVAARDAHKGEPETAAYYQRFIDDMQVALEKGRPFAPELPACATRAAIGHPMPAKLPPTQMAGKLVIVTDRACFSSCLIGVDLFRRVGALHVGEVTDRSTRYMEVREITLPSGLRTFSVLQKLSLGSGDFGPYKPEIDYPGFMDDDDGLRAWVAQVVRQR
ncbi:MAG TPA: hypothetical protein VGE65_09510 [Sphingobium sp.]